MGQQIEWADFCIALEWADAPAEIVKVLSKATAYFKRPVVQIELLLFAFNLTKWVKRPKDKDEAEAYDRFAALAGITPTKEFMDSFISKINQTRKKFGTISGRELYTEYSRKKTALNKAQVFNEAQFYNFVSSVIKLKEKGKELGVDVKNVGTNTNFFFSLDDLNKAEKEALTSRFLRWILDKNARGEYYADLTGSA